MNDFGYLSLIPATVTILVAVSTHRVATALFAGIVSGSLLVAGYNSILASSKTIYHYLAVSFCSLERLQIGFFLFFVGAMLSVINISGGYNSFSKWISKYLTNARRSRVAVFILSLLVFIDDYANVLICGASMRSMAKTHKISPALLTYVVDRTATVASFVVVSTWAAFESSLMLSAGEPLHLTKTAIEYFVEALPYHASTYLGIILVALTVWQGKWVGAHFDKGDTASNIDDSLIEPNTDGKLRYMLIPLLLLISMSLGGMLYFTHLGMSANTNSKSIITIIGEIPIIKILLVSSLIAWLSGMIVILVDRVFSMKDVFKASFSGIKSMISPVMVIILAKGLSEISVAIGVGSFIGLKLSAFVIPQLIPGIIFVISLLITVSTGFSWSSMVIVMPIAYDLVLSNNIPEMLPVVSGAVISGAISGALMVPYSDKTVLTAAAFGISPIYHVRTQLIQSIISSITAFIFFIIIGFYSNYFLASVTSIAILGTIQFIFAKKDTFYINDKKSTT